jgi:glutathione S-transferase
MLANGKWIMELQVSLADACTLVFYSRGPRIELLISELLDATAWKDRMLARPAVRQILAARTARF